MASKAKSDGAAAGSAATQLVTAGRDASDQYGFVNTPVVRGSTVLWSNTGDLKAHRGRYTYGRRGNPTTDALSEAMTAIEGGAGVALLPSGLAACSTAILSVVEAGGHILVTDSVYQPTRTFCSRTLKRFGVETTFYDPRIGSGIAGLMRPNTQAVFAESPGSQTFEVQDVPAIVAAAHARGAAVILDNTWASPLFFDAHGHGVDLSVQAATKYVSGHSDVMVGTVSATDAWWPRLKETVGNIGLCLSPDDAYLALRGLRTMGVRLRHQEQAALAVARWLEARPEVLAVLHPALESHPDHALFKRDFRGSSGLFSIVLQPAPEAAVAAFLDTLELFGLGFSWGGYESLAVPFDARAYRTATSWSPGGPTVRLHIGLEEVDDLLADLDRGLEAFTAAL